MDYSFLIVIAVILLFTKLFGLASRRVHMPQVVGALAAGVILGPSVLGVVSETDFLLKVSELGVIFLMFTAGLETDIEELHKTGFSAFIIALIGVIVPMLGGAGCYLLFNPDLNAPQAVLKAAFVGVVLTATSVSITVETLREMGKLKSRIGTAILGAAIIDDILGIMALAVLSGFTDSGSSVWLVLGKLVLYVLFILVVGFCVQWLFIRISRIWPNKHRVAIYGLAFCLVMSFVSEHFFGVADITGAYFAGLILCNIANVRDYVTKQMEVVSYLVFSPLFFASIGIKTEVSGMTGGLVLFALALCAVAVASKILGCGLGAKLTGFGGYDSFLIGLGMVSRGEVALIVAQKGSQAGLIDPELFPPVVLMVIVTTLITPILLRIAMKRPSPGAVELTGASGDEMPNADAWLPDK